MFNSYRKANQYFKGGEMISSSSVMHFTLVWQHLTLREFACATLHSSPRNGRRNNEPHVKSKLLRGIFPLQLRMIEFPPSSSKGFRESEMRGRLFLLHCVASNRHEIDDWQSWHDSEISLPKRDRKGMENLKVSGEWTWSKVDNKKGLSIDPRQSAQDIPLNPMIILLFLQKMTCSSDIS